MEGTLPLVAAALPWLSEEQLKTLERLRVLVGSWEGRVNLVSRGDGPHLEERHLLMSLLVARAWQPAEGERCLDLGTGGGFPGLPLAVAFPRAHFTLCDSVAKKARAVQEVLDALGGLQNVRVVAARAETLGETFDVVMGRAVTALPAFLRLAGPLATRMVLYFKGTRWEEELEGSSVRPEAVHDLHAWVDRPFFEGKYLLQFRAPVRIEDHIRHDTNVNMHASAPERGGKRAKHSHSKKRR